MNKEQLQHRAYHTYAAIGELTLRKKQLNQQLQQINEKLEALEQEIVTISKTKPSDDTNKEGVHNVD